MNQVGILLLWQSWKLKGRGRMVLVFKGYHFEVPVLRCVGAGTVPSASSLGLPLKMFPNEITQLLVTTSLVCLSCYLSFSRLPDLL